MKKILILYNSWNGKCVTGGQFYEENMYECLLDNSDFEVERFCINRKKSFFYKLLAPILNIKYLQKCKVFDLVIFNSVEGWYFIPLLILIRLFSATKVAIIHHHFMYLEFSGLKKIFYKNLESLFLRLANYIITVSPYIQELSKKKFPYKDIRIWPIPFSDIIIDVPVIQKEDGSLLYMGTIEPRKGLIYLMKALIVLKENNINYNLNIIGKIIDQEYYDGLHKIIEQNNLKVNFLGFVDEATKDRLLKEAQVFIFPSLLEGYGMVLREVMSYGLPTVCFNNSAMPYLVKNGVNGIVVENKNTAQLAEAIISILSDCELRDNLIKGAYDSTKQTMNYLQFRVHLVNELKYML